MARSQAGEDKQVSYGRELGRAKRRGRQDGGQRESFGLKGAPTLRQRKEVRKYHT